MKHLKTSFLLFAASLAIVSCDKDDDIPAANNVTLQFDNTFGDTSIVLGGETSSTATVNTSEAGQVHHFSELKYIISNIRLIKADGTEIPYNINDLDNGATVINHSKPETLKYILNTIPSAEYAKIKFGLGIKTELNTLDETKFPNFYAIAEANDTEMMWEWGTGYRFTKIEGFYDTDNKNMSVHTGSTVEKDDNDNTIQGVDAYRDICLDLPTNAIVGKSAPTISITADFNMLLSGKTNTITLGDGNATPSVHHAGNMVLFVDNLGGNGTTDTTGMFSVSNVSN